MVKTPQLQSEQNQQQINQGQNSKKFPLLRRRSLRIERRQSSIENIIQILQSKRNNNQVWICVDFDSFSVNCHLLENPQFKNRPCIVTWYYDQNQVICSNKIAREKIDKKEKKKSVYQAEYGDNLKCFIQNKYLQYPKAKILRKIAKQYDPFFESCGNDEVYINVTSWVNQSRTVMSLVHQIKEKVETLTSLKVTCGVGPTAYLSKMATNQSKKNQSQISYTKVIPGDNQYIRTFLGQKKVSDLQEINEVTQKLLHEFQIFLVKDIISNAKQLYQSDQIQKKKLVYYALGVDTESLQSSKQFTSNSEFQLMESKQDIQKQIIRLIECCEHFLQRYELVTNKISLNLKIKKQDVLNKIINLSIFTDKKEDLLNQISKYFDQINDQMNLTNIVLKLYNLNSKPKEGGQIKAPKSKKIQKPKQNIEKQKLQSKRGRKKKNAPQQSSLKNTKEKDSKQPQ